MKKLHVKVGDIWKPVFCHHNGQVETCESAPEKALPTKAMWAEDDLYFFKTKFASHEFCLMIPETNAKR